MEKLIGEYSVRLPVGAKKIIVVKNTVRWKMNPLKYWWDQSILPAGNYELKGLKGRYAILKTIK